MISRATTILTLGLVLACSHHKQKAQKPVNHISSAVGIALYEQRPDEGFSGTGTSFSFVRPDDSDSDVVFGYLATDEEPIIRINDHPFRLKFIRSAILKEGSGPNRLGRRKTEVWGNSEVNIELDYQNARIEDGETGLEGTMTVSYSGKKAVFKIRGGFGE